MLLSAARSDLFNQVLAARVAAGNWDDALDGEVWMLDGSRSVFGPEPFNDDLRARLAAFDIHPSGPLWGEGPLRSTGDAAACEMQALQGDTAMRLRAGLEQARTVAGAPRAAAAARCTGMGMAGLRCAGACASTLPPGCYATTVLRELGDITDAASPS